MIIDAHVHVFDAEGDTGSREVGPLFPRSDHFHMSDLHNLMRFHAVDGAVLLTLDPTDRYAIDTPTTGRNARILEWAPDSDPGRLLGLIAANHAAGVRVVDITPKSSSDSGSLDETAEQLFSGLESAGGVLSLYLGESQLHLGITIADRYPSLRIVLNHVGFPRPTTGSWLMAPLRNTEPIQRPAPMPSMRCRGEKTLPLCCQDSAVSQQSRFRIWT